MTKRQYILNKIKTVIQGISNFKTVEVGSAKILTTDIETSPLPACFIYSDKETKYLEGENAVIGKETWEWYVVLLVRAIDADLEDLLDLIHTEMYANYKLGNYAEWSERMGVDFLTIDPTKQIEDMIIPYRIIYRHTLGDMEV